MNRGNEETPRLAPAMVSRRLIVLSFVRDYIGIWSASPSLGEIAAGCGISRSRARQLVEALVREGRLAKSPGTRGLSLPESRDHAVRLLRDLGWVVDELTGCAKAPLPPAARLDYVPDAQQHGVSDGGETEGAAGV